jgi:cytochrome c
MQILVKEELFRPVIRCVVKIVFLCPLVATICLADSPSLPEQFGIGREATASEIERWDIDVMPDGKQLPTGQGTVDEGEKTYLQECLACHGPEGRNGINDQLVERFKPDSDFANDKTLTKTIGNYWPYATTLYDYINRAMPMTAPGSLNADEVYSLVAYLLYLNGIVEKEITLDARTLPAIEMPANRLFYWSEEARALVGDKE